eukprot:1142285-Pelagomonas_calceolata.AAC.3
MGGRRKELGDTEPKLWEEGSGKQNFGRCQRWHRKGWGWVSHGDDLPNRSLLLLKHRNQLHKSTC